MDDLDKIAGVTGEVTVFPVSRDKIVYDFRFAEAVTVNRKIFRAVPEMRLENKGDA